MKRIALAMLAVILFAGAAAAARPAQYAMWTPDVLVPAQTAPATLEVTVGATVGSASFVRFTGDTPRPLRNDGQGGDRAAGDRIFTIRFDAAELLGWYNASPAAVQRSPVFTAGSVRLNDASGTLLSTASITMPVRTDSMPRVAVTTLAAGVAQYTPHVFNAAMPAGYFNGTATSDFPATQALYSFFHDQFEFVVMVVDGNLFQASTFHRAQENVTGLGRPLSPLDPAYGSAGRLEGAEFLAGISRLDVTTGCAQTFLHELGHRWVNQLNGPLHDPHGGHWPLGNLAGGIMGFSAHDGSGNGAGIAGTGDLVPDGNDLLAQPFRTCPTYNDVELYLMGLRPESQVQPKLVATDQNQLPQGSPFPRILGPFQTVTIQDSIAVNGVRRPGFERSTKQFRAAVILATSERLASADLMQWAESQAMYLNSIFHTATGGAGRLRTDLEPARITFPPMGPRIQLVRNGASLAAGPVSPGSIIRLEGTGLGPTAEVSATPQTGVAGPTELGSTRVTVNGVRAVLLAASGTSVTAIVPSTLTGHTKTAAIQVERVLHTATLLSNVASMPLAARSTAVFSQNGLGANAAVVFHTDGTLNTAANPAAGAAVVDIIVNGAGPFATPLPDGSLAPVNATPAALAAGTVEVLVQSQPATVLAATAIPGELASKARVRVQLPVFIDGVLERTLLVRIGGITSQNGVRLFAAKPQP